MIYGAILKGKMIWVFNLFYFVALRSSGAVTNHNRFHLPKHAYKYLFQRSDHYHHLLRSLTSVVQHGLFDYYIKYLVSYASTVPPVVVVAQTQVVVVKQAMIAACF